MLEWISRHHGTLLPQPFIGIEVVTLPGCDLTQGTFGWPFNYDASLLYSCSGWRADAANDD